MADVWTGVSAAYDKPSYTQGQTITVTISGSDEETNVTTQNEVGPLVLNLTAADGSTFALNVPAQSVTLTSTTVAESVKITSIQDTSATPRVWTIAANGLSATATA